MRLCSLAVLYSGSMEEEYGQAGQDNLQAIEFQVKHFLIINSFIHLSHYNDSKQAYLLMYTIIQ